MLTCCLFLKVLPPVGKLYVVHGCCKFGCGTLVYYGHVVHSVYICGLTLILNDMSAKSIILTAKELSHQSKHFACLRML